MAESRPTYVYVGTYSNTYPFVTGKGRGIYRFTFNSADGSLTPVGSTLGIVDPAYLALAPNRRFLYSVNESKETDGRPGGGVSAFSIDPQTADLKFLNRLPSGGQFPNYLTVDRTGSVVLVVNHDGGTVLCFPIQSDGRLGEASDTKQHRSAFENPTYDQSPHPHSINVDATNRFAIVPDKGTDKVVVYRIDPRRGTLTANDPPYVATAPGSAPRHLVFHPTRPYVFVIHESGGTVSSFTFDTETGVLVEVNTVSTLPASFAASNYTADLRIHPNGKFLYGTNRGHDSIASFAVDEATGRLRALGHTPTGGKTPRHIRFDPTGAILLAANQDSDSIVAFSVDATTGSLTPTGAVAHTPTPVCILFLDE